MAFPISLCHFVIVSLCHCIQAIPHRGPSLMLAQWPSASQPQDKEALQSFDDLRGLVSIPECSLSPEAR